MSVSLLIGIWLGGAIASLSHLRLIAFPRTSRQWAIDVFESLIWFVLLPLELAASYWSRRRSRES